MQALNLATGWQLKARDAAHELPLDFTIGDGWLPATVPGTVHQDLLGAGRIPDPFTRLNEHDVQWVGTTDWLYRLSFDIPAEMLAEPHLDLCLDGLDTFASVWLNGHHILTSDNMFVPARVAVKALLKPTGNTLHILFESALRRGRALEAQHGHLRAWNGDTSRLYVRKAQYHYGWDWGPTLMTAGLWRGARLEAYPSRIVDIHTPVTVSDDLARATVPVSVTVDNPAAVDSVGISLYTPAGELLAREMLPSAAGRETHSHTFNVSNPQLWYPRGYGGQPRYRVVVEMSRGGRVIEAHELRLGLRRLRLVQEPITGEAGTSFYVEINNVPIFCGGANWIPADSFTPRVTADDYRQWLRLAADGNMVMLRVWGGGIYEEDTFYDLCDEMGVLVWQDFMFACGMYPAHPDFLASVRAEAEANVRRLRHFASVVIWCGNNEDYQVAESINAYDPSFNGDFVHSPFPAREIYERLLPEVCAQLDPTRPYWQGSPYGGKSVHEQSIGDRHTWEIWHGPMADYHDYVDYHGRFVSEFGMQAAPESRTIEGFTAPEDRTPHSAVMVHHNKATDGPKRLEHYLSANLPPVTEMDDYIYKTQFVQSEAVAAAVNGWRRRWGGPAQYRTGGALVWQINDCWPVISWALADYHKRPKPGYFHFRRRLAPFVVGARQHDGSVDVWAVNGTLDAAEFDLDIQFWSFAGERLTHERQRINLAPNRATELGKFAAAAELQTGVVLSLRLMRGDEVIARACAWPEPAKSVPLPDPDLKIVRADPCTLRLSVTRPARGVRLTADHDLRWSDNMLDLIPGDEQLVSIGNDSLEGARISVRWLGATTDQPVTT